MSEKDGLQKESQSKETPKPKKAAKKKVLKNKISIPGFGVVEADTPATAEMEKAYKAYIDKYFNDGDGKYTKPKFEDLCK